MKLMTLSLLACLILARGATVLPMSEEEEWKAAAGVCRGLVEAVKAVENAETGRIHTEVTIRVEESLRGRFPERVVVRMDGGSVPGRGEQVGGMPVLKPGMEQLFYFSRKAGGRSLHIERGHQGVKAVERGPGGKFTLAEDLRQRRLRRWKAAGDDGADFTDLAAAAPAAGGVQQAEVNGSGNVPAGLLVDDISLLPARWVAPDRGEPIPYIVDATVLPAGVSLEQALTALENAFAAWTAATGVTFRFEGLQDFAAASPDVLVRDEKIRVQLHDTFGYIASSGTLAIGGREWSSVEGALSMSGGGGGQVAGVEFHRAVRGYVVVRHSSAAVSNLKTLEETLCHEIGHVLGLGHSSENPSEPSAELREAMMYFRVRQDNRGATLGSYDPPLVRSAHPQTNTPPWAFPRYVTAHTGTVAQTSPGVNEVVLQGFDGQTPPAGLSVVTGATSGTQATLALTGNTIRITPSANHPDSGLGDPLNFTYAKVLYRFNDGTHCSPWQPVSVIAFRRDTVPAAGDGLPDSWMTTHFGNKDPGADPRKGPAGDYDGDGLTNLQEYRLGTNPTRGQSRFDMTVQPGDQLQWLARPWGLYLLERSEDGVNWEYWQSIIPKTISGSVTAPRDPLDRRRFLRLRYME